MKRLQAGFLSAFVTAGAVLTFAPATTGCSASTQVISVFMALDGTGNRVRDTFYPDTTSIYCDIDWVGRDPDTTLNAFIHQHKGETAPGSGSLAPVDRILGVGESNPGEQNAIVSFTWSLTSTDGGGTPPYPVGEFTCDIQVNGVAAGSTTFDITYPGCKKTDPSNCGGDGTDCPLGGAAINGTVCIGLYRDGANCPSTTAASTTNACTCNKDGNGLWACSQ
jgi:hypothetical protein